jgi:hypothetical protein
VERSPRGKAGDRVGRTLGHGLPNDREICPEAESHAVGLSGGNSGIPAGFWVPKGTLSGEMFPGREQRGRAWREWRRGIDRPGGCIRWR